MSSLVITLVGPDRPGLVGRVSDVVRQHSGNWLESRMAHLAGQFAGIVLVDVADEHADALAAALNGLTQQGLKLIVERDVVLSSSSSTVGSLVSLNVVGSDRPGIVREVTQVLTASQVNVEEFTTHCSAAPMSGGRIFKVEAQLRLPDRLTLQQLRNKLEAVANDLMVDISLKSE
ncbi:MAG: ACT domain-containing protein [Planctomycetaceae bacterium]